MMKCSLHNLGCKVNSYETQAMQQMMEEAGYEIVPFGEAISDVYTNGNKAQPYSKEIVNVMKDINNGKFKPRI